MTLLTRAFWLDAGERAAKTFAQTTLAAYGLTVFVAGTALHAVEAGAVAAGLSVLTSIASAGARGTVSPASVAPAVDPPTGRHARRSGTVELARSTPRPGYAPGEESSPPT